MIEDNSENCYSESSFRTNYIASVFTSSGKNVGSLNGYIRTKMFGNGKARLDFGNCGRKGTVKVLINSKEIDSAPPVTISRSVEFEFTDGDELEIREEVGVILFNYFEVLECQG